LGYNESTGQFNLDAGTFPIPFFPIEGIYTRQVNVPTDKPQPYPTRFIETSSPGLRGHSGGPLVDRDGVVWGLQSQTHTLDLGFEGKVKRGGRGATENQFLNVGWATSADSIAGFLEHHGIAFQQAG